MQVHQPKVGDAEASTKPARIRPPMAAMKLDHPSNCDICGKHRSKGNHQACSRKRQEIKSAEWDAYMAEQAAAKQAKERRYAR